MDTQIEVVSGKITLGVSEAKEYTNTSINKLSAGGRNILLKSDERSINATASGGDSYTNTTGDLLVTVSSQSWVKIYYNGSFSTEVEYFSKALVFSVEVYGTNTNGVPPMFYPNASFNYKRCQGTVVNGKWSRIFCAVTYGTNNNEWHLQFAGCSGSYRFRKPKLEVGNVPTDWSLAPEDIEDDWQHYTDVAKSELESEIQILSNQISLKVSQADFNALGTRVTNAEAQITINKNAIEQRVTKTEYTTGIDNANFLATVLNKGLMLNSDPTFKNGYNGISVYNNSGGSGVTITRKTISGIPNDSGYGIEIVRSGTSSPGSGGFIFGTSTKANRVLVCRFVAKIPAGSNVEFASNATGDSSVRKWLTDHSGSGDWKEYAFYVKCGASGTFSSTMFFYISSGANVTWWLAYATVFDANAAEQYTSLSTYTTKITQLENSISLKASQTTVDSLSGRVTTAESKIEQNANAISLKVSQSDVDNSINNIDLGGRNLLKNSTRISSASAASGITFANVTFSGLDVSRVVASSGNGNYLKINGFDILASLEPRSSKMCFSFDVYGSSTNGAAPTLYTDWTGYMNNAKGASVVNNSWRRIYFIFDFKVQSPNFHLGWSGRTGTYYLKNFKLEFGNKPTDWSPAPEDVSSDAQGVIQEKLYDTGIDIDAKTVTVTASSFKVQNNAGTAIAVFKTASNGNTVLQASYIDVDNLTVKKLDGATGSFENLTCVDSSGNTVGTLSFDSSGRLWFNGDMYHQGTKDGRALRYYMSDVWVRGSFGSAERNTMVVYGSYAYVFTKGPSGSSTYIPLTSKTSSNNETYYVVDGYSPRKDYNGETAGFPIDVIVFRITSNTVYRFQISLINTQRVLIVNANDSYDNVDIYLNGSKFRLANGRVAELIQLSKWMYPTPDSSNLGRGLMIASAGYDNNW